MRILVVEDDSKLARVLKLGLEAELFAVDVAADGMLALELCQTTPYDVVVLDLGLPGMHGLELLSCIRRCGLKVPVIVVSGANSVADRVRGLEAGADDYMGKPLHFSELTARIRAILRRPTGGVDRLRIGDLEMDCLQHRVTRAGQNIALTPKEYSVLEFLMRHPNRVISRTSLVHHVWNGNFEGLTNSVDVYIHHLRQKLYQSGKPGLIQTVFRMGYVLRDPSVEATRTVRPKPRPTAPQLETPAWIVDSVQNRPPLPDLRPRPAPPDPTGSGD
jgi:DNA-binding response OmpR family regulator